MGQSTFSLAGDFPPMDRTQWRSAAETALKGRPIDRLVRDIGGLAVQPLYTRADAVPGREGDPGQAPYTRGWRNDRPPWAIQQVYRPSSLAALNRAILTDLERGVTSVEVVVEPGGPLNDAGDLEAVLTGVYEDLVPVGLAAGAHGPTAAATLIALWKRRGRARATHRAALNLDPIDAWIRTGSIEATPPLGLSALADVARFVHDNWPLVSTARVDTSIYHEAGAAEATEVALALATGVAYLDAMLGAGLSLDDAAPHVNFRLAVDADLFLNVAKLRAFRQTWARVLSAAGAGPSALASVRLEASTSRAMMTRRDPWVNILRSTVGAFAAAVGGADVIHVRPFDETIGISDELALRIARNTQIILQDESHLAQVTDPAGGAWYVEHLTTQLAEAAWSQFQGIQGQGGVVDALGSGSIQDTIDEHWATRKKAISRRKEAITGVSEFPHLQEEPVVRPAASASSTVTTADDTLDLGWPSRAAAGDLTRRAVQAASAGASIVRTWDAWQATLGAPDAALARTLQLQPRAGGYEALRDASDRYLQTNGRRPRVHLVTLGSVAEHTARATFAKNFFEAGGIETVATAPLLNTDDARNALEPQGDASVAVICGTDDRYAEEVEAVAPALKATGVVALYLAGRPGDREAAYRQAGVDGFIFVGCDVLEILARIHTQHFQAPSSSDAKGDRP